VLRSQDILILLKLLPFKREWTYDQISRELGLSSSAVHRSTQRMAKSGLYKWDWREPDRPALAEFLVHGLRYVFPPEWHGEARGIPTAWAAPPLARKLVSSENNPPVWPDPEGPVFGIALEPLDARAPEAAQHDDALRELLALIDAIRIGNARERGLAAKQLEERVRG
jgi:hypothetical protein